MNVSILLALLFEPYQESHGVVKRVALHDSCERIVAPGRAPRPPDPVGAGHRFVQVGQQRLDVLLRRPGDFGDFTQQGSRPAVLLVGPASSSRIVVGCVAPCEEAAGWLSAAIAARGCNISCFMLHVEQLKLALDRTRR